MAGKPLKMKVVDLSAGGLCVLAPADEATRLKVGERLPEVKVSLPPEEPFSMPAVIRYVRPDAGGPVFLQFLKGPGPKATSPKGGAQVRCGVEFLPPREGHRDRLFRIVAKREREMLGRRQHLRSMISGWVVLHLDGQLPRLRRLVDLSAGGIQVDLEGGDTDAPFAPGVTLRAIEVRVAGEQPFTCPGTVRRVNRTGPQVTCGLELSLSPALKQRVDEFIKHASSQRA
jgi:c-di-GMP-binding flagellar brake protein YcgR